MTVARTIRFTLVVIVLLAPGSTLADSGVAACANRNPQLQRALTDAWLRGKVDMALLLNRYLNSFDISTSVKKGRVTLSGTVKTRIDRELAEQIVLGIDGITSVDNRLAVSPARKNHKQASARYQRIRDVTLTAQVKSRLVLDRHVDAMNIDVNTRNAVVTLKGHVGSQKEKDLALRIVRNTENVKSVRDRLEVVPAS